jgi:hypothetical protein
MDFVQYMNMVHGLQVRKSQHTSTAFREKWHTYMHANQQRNTERYFTMNESWSEWLNTNVHKVIIKTS